MSHQIGVMCLGHTEAVVELSFSNDFGSGFYLASAGLDGVAMLRHGDTGHMITRCHPTGEMDPLEGAELVPGRLLCSAAY